MNQKTAELEKNELSDWVESKFGWLKPYVGTIVLGFLALLLLAIMGGYWMALMRNSASQPWADLQMARVSFEQDMQTSHFDSVIERHPNTLASLWALQQQGDLDLRIGLSKLVSDRDAALKQIERARKSLEKIQESTLKKPDLLTERSLFSLAYACESLGDFDQARSIYKRLIEEMPDAPFVANARTAVQRLENPELLTAFTKFKTVGTAPGISLPPIPDISFPEDTPEEGPELTPTVPAADDNAGESTPPADGGNGNPEG